MVVGNLGVSAVVVGWEGCTRSSFEAIALLVCCACSFFDCLEECLVQLDMLYVVLLCPGQGTWLVII